MMLATGCSIAHGQGNVEENYHKDNVLDSYPNIIAEYLKVKCNNIAYPGYSNEMIFHSTMAELQKEKYLYCLVSWTSNSREVWENENEIYMFNLNYARYENKHREKNNIFYQRINNIGYTTNDTNISFEKLENMYPCIETKILTQNESLKLKNYQRSIQTFCYANNINLVEVNAIKNNDDSNLYLLSPALFYNPKGINFHPPKSSHIFWANDIYKKCYEK